MAGKVMGLGCLYEYGMLTLNTKITSDLGHQILSNRHR